MISDPRVRGHRWGPRTRLIVNLDCYPQRLCISAKNCPGCIAKADDDILGERPCMTPEEISAAIDAALSTRQVGDIAFVGADLGGSFTEQHPDYLAYALKRRNELRRTGTPGSPRACFIGVTTSGAGFDAERYIRLGLNSCTYSIDCDSPLHTRSTHAQGVIYNQMRMLRRNGVDVYVNTTYSGHDARMVTLGDTLLHQRVFVPGEGYVPVVTEWEIAPFQMRGEPTPKGHTLQSIVTPRKLLALVTKLMWHFPHAPTTISCAVSAAELLEIARITGEELCCNRWTHEVQFRGVTFTALRRHFAGVKWDGRVLNARQATTCIGVQPGACATYEGAASLISFL